jgi:hypothetical protein
MEIAYSIYILKPKQYLKFNPEFNAKQGKSSQGKFEGKITALRFKGWAHISLMQSLINYATFLTTPMLPMHE